MRSVLGPEYGSISGTQETGIHCGCTLRACRKSNRNPASNSGFRDPAGGWGWKLARCLRPVGALREAGSTAIQITSHQKPNDSTPIQATNRRQFWRPGSTQLKSTATKTNPTNWLDPCPSHQPQANQTNWLDSQSSHQPQKESSLARLPYKSPAPEKASPTSAVPPPHPPHRPLSPFPRLQNKDETSRRQPHTVNSKHRTTRRFTERVRTVRLKTAPHHVCYLGTCRAAQHKAFLNEQGQRVAR